METQVHGGGGGGGAYRGTGTTGGVTISSTTVVHDQIFLQGKNGKERAFQLQDFDIACREGNNLTVLWAIRKGHESGPYFCIHNHTTSQTFFSDTALGRIFMRAPTAQSIRGAIVFGIIGIFIGLLVAIGKYDAAFSKILSLPPSFGLWGAVGGGVLGLVFQLPDKRAVRRFKSVLKASFLRTNIE